MIFCNQESCIHCTEDDYGSLVCSIEPTMDRCPGMMPDVLVCNSFEKRSAKNTVPKRTFFRNKDTDLFPGQLELREGGD